MKDGMKSPLTRALFTFLGGDGASAGYPLESDCRPRSLLIQSCRTFDQFHPVPKHCMGEMLRTAKEGGEIGAISIAALSG